MIQEDQQICFKRGCEQCILNDDHCDDIQENNSQYLVQQEKVDDSNLIQPCFCNLIMHRECIKRKIIKQRSPKCVTCSANYQARETNSIYAQSFKKYRMNKIIMKALVNIFGTVIIALALLYLIQIKTYQLYDYILQMITVVFGCISCLLMIVYIFLIIANGIIRSKILDIEILCYQNETKLHTDKQVVERFLERLKLSGINV
ncbi:unnamed protein product [Paramecium octaurelia]|uniref:Uncharacterized protein n=1 Tax=Paramecium octaurelia TaxID=43137 RepID=A0A8S1RW79_PAROT|nr:unnamed protein product [Paramecium octaurelia]